METNKTNNSLEKPGINSQNNSAQTFVNRLIDKNIHKMNSHNQEAAIVMKTQGVEAAIEHMFIDQKTGTKLTYAEMRARYG
jgi:hypothetical protein